MSDSEFEDLTSQVYASKIKNQLNTSKLRMSKLVDEREEMMMKISELTITVQNNKKQIDAKNSMLKTITSDEIKLSKKLLILQQQKTQLKQDLLKTEKHYQHEIEQLLKEKQQLVMINKQLSENLIRLEGESMKQKQKSQEVRRKSEDQYQTLKQSLSKIENQLHLANKRLQQQILEIDEKTTKINSHQSSYQQLVKDFESFKLKTEQESSKLNQHHEDQVNNYKNHIEQIKSIVSEKQTVIKQKNQQVEELNSINKQLMKEIIDLEEKSKLSCQMLEKQLTQQISKYNKLAEENKSLNYELNRLTQESIQKQTHLHLQVKLLQQENKDSQQQIKRLSQLINQAKQQINGQLPSAQILFLIQKFLKLNKQQSLVYMKSCQLTQEDRSSIEYAEIDDLVRRIHHLLPKEFALKKNKK